MYQTPDNTKLRNQLAHDIKNLNQDLATSPRSSARLLLDVELGLYLAEKLNLALEPITVVWSLLCGISVLDDTLLNLDVEQQLALANSRMILGSRYSGRFSWEQALRDYIRYVPCTIRLYDYPVNQSLDNNLIDGSRRDYQDTRREEYYDKCLNDYLNFDRSNKGNDVEVNHEYYIDAQMQDNTNHQKVTITFSDNDIAIASKTILLLSNEQRKRQTQRISLHDLSITAQFIDKREALLGSTREGKSWLARLNDIHYQMIDEDGNLSDADDIEIDGLMNLAGMVGSGKSTLATLIAAHYIHRWQDTEAYRSLELDRIPLRITIVLGDVASCNDLADKINQWFCDNPESTQPVAVPLIGRTTRASHIKQFNESAGYKRALADDRIHSGERFLNPTCPLQAKLTVEQLPQPIIAGKEPCTTIMLPASKEKIKQAKLDGKRPPKPKPHLCPFFVQCPSQQIWHDMVNAQVWITTPAGMAQGALPRQMESRRVKIGDVIYEQSDLVIFDEADTVMDWFDRVYAQEVKLAAAGQGLLDEIHRKLPPYWEQNRNLDALTSRWVQSTNNVMNPVGHVLKQLQQYRELRSWLTRGYFTANSLFYKIARRFLGLKEYEDEREDNKRQSNEQRIQPILDVFNVLKGPDPLEREIPNGYVQDKPVTYRQLWKQWQLKEKTANIETNKVYQNLIDHAVFRLIHIMQTTMNVGDSTQSDEVLRRYERWIIEFMPDIEDRLINLRVQLEEKASSEWWQQEYLDESLDKNLETLAKRLELAVNAALLDRHTRIIFYEWHNRPDGLINDSQPYQRVPLSVQNILPRPITGQLFGIYYWS